MVLRPPALSKPVWFLLGELTYFVARDLLPTLVVAAVTHKPVRWI